MNALYDAPVDDAWASRASPTIARPRSRSRRGRRGLSLRLRRRAHRRRDRRSLRAPRAQARLRRPRARRSRRRRWTPPAAAPASGMLVELPLDDRAVLRRRAGAAHARHRPLRSRSRTCASSACCRRRSTSQREHDAHRHDRSRPETQAAPRQDVRRRHHAAQARRHHRRAVRGQEDRLRRQGRHADPRSGRDRAHQLVRHPRVGRLHQRGLGRRCSRCGSSSARPRSSISSTWSPTSAAPVTSSASTRPIAATTATTIAARLVQVAQDWETLKTGKLPERVCESCGNAEYFDEDPLTFFSFLQSHPPVADAARRGGVPGVAAQLLGRRRRAQAQDREADRRPRHLPEAVAAISTPASRARRSPTAPRATSSSISAASARSIPPAPPSGGR